MRKPPWTVRKSTYVVIEAILGGIFGWIPFVGGSFTSCLKLVLQTDEEKRQKESLTAVAITQEEYDALDHKDEKTLYAIVEKKDSKE